MRILLCGAAGRMGLALRRLLDESPEMTLAAAVDARSGYLPSPEAFAGEADCLIDFSHPDASETLSAFAVRRGMPAVVGTTGHTGVQRACWDAAARSVPVFLSPNMSPAVAMLAEMAAWAAAVFPEADVEIVERHHNRKADVPSGTALMLAKAIQAVRPGAAIRVGRSESGRRTQNEIGVHSLRLGGETGTHEVILATDAQTLTLRHAAQDRALFAQGALQAAAFIVRQPAGLYGMHDLLAAQKKPRSI